MLRPYLQSLPGLPGPWPPRKPGASPGGGGYLIKKETIEAKIGLRCVGVKYERDLQNSSKARSSSDESPDGYIMLQSEKFNKASKPSSSEAPRRISKRSSADRDNPLDMFKKPEDYNRVVQILRRKPLDSAEEMTSGPLKGHSFDQICRHDDGVQYIRSGMMHLRNNPSGVFLQASDSESFIRLAAFAWEKKTGRSIVLPDEPMTGEDDDPCNVQMVHDVFEATDEDEPGLAVVDTACGSTMHGDAWRRKFANSLAEKELMCAYTGARKHFSGIGGKTISSRLYRFPVGIEGNNGEISSHEVRGSAPLLLSKGVMQKIGMVLDMGKGTYSIDSLGITDAKLKTTSKGHYAVSLLDFGEEDHQGLDHSRRRTGEVYEDPSDSHQDNEDAIEVNAQVCDGENEVEEETRTAGFDNPYEKMDESQKRTSGKKTRKIQRAKLNLEISDYYHEKTLGMATTSDRAPFTTRTHVKHIFSTVSGLTLVAMSLGLLVGKPIDFGEATNGGILSKRNAMKQVWSDLDVEDPYLTVVSVPSAPWARLRTGDAAQSAREFLKFSAKIAKHRVERGRHVLLESSDPTAFYSEEFKLVEEMTKNDALHIGSESHIMTSMITLPEIDFERKEKGSGKFTTEFSEAILHSMFQQVEVDYEETADSFPVDAGAPLRPRKRNAPSAPEDDAMGRESPEDVDQPEEEGLPPVPRRRRAREKRPPNERDIEIEEQRLIGEMVREDLQKQPDDDHPPEEIVLPEAEKERRRAWNALPAQVRKELKRAHVNFGHPTNVALMRICTRAKCKPEIIKAIELLRCDVCGDHIKKKSVRPVKMPGHYVFNYHISCDTLFAQDFEANSYAFLNIVCNGTKYQVVGYLGCNATPSAETCRDLFINIWQSWAGLPQLLTVDAGKEWLGPFTEWMSTHGVELTRAPTERWQVIGLTEKMGGLWKELWKRVVDECHVVGEDDVKSTAGIVTQTINETTDAGGYAPAAWVLGSHGLRVPGSLLQDGEAERLEVQEAAEDPMSEMAKNLARRTAARVARIYLDNDARFRRARLHRAVPLRGPFPVGAYVYFRRSVPRTGEGGRRGKDKKEIVHRWCGVARVIGHEKASHKVTEELIDHGESSHGVWLRYGPTVVLCSPEQLRFATEDELHAHRSFPAELKEEETNMGARMYTDIRSEAAHLPPGAFTEIEDSATGGGCAPGAGVLTDGGGIEKLAEDDSADPFLTGESEEDVPKRDAGQEPGILEREEARLQAGIQPNAGNASAARPEEAGAPPEDGRTRRPMDIDAAGEEASGEPSAAPRARSRSRGRSRSPRPRERRTAVGEEDEELYVEEVKTCTDPYEYFEESYFEGNGMQCIVEEVFLTGRMRNTEINYHKLPSEQKVGYDASMKKEWQNWLLFDAVDRLTEEEVAALPEGTSIVNMRWVHTDKNSKLRVPGDVTSDIPVIPKSRLVVIGCQEKHAIRSDSPTASLLIFNLACCMASLKGWVMMKADATSAYLQGGEITRMLILRAPRPAPPGEREGQLYRAKGSIYGTRDAGRSWWLKVKKTLLQIGFIESVLEPAWFLLTRAGRLIGAVLVHVDDFLIIGEEKDSMFVDAVEALKRALKLTMESPPMRYCGKLIERTSAGDVLVSQKEAAESIEEIMIDKARKKQPDALLDELEVTELRRVIGSLGWIARQTRPDISVHSSKSAQRTGNPTVQDMIDANKAVQLGKENAGAKLVYRANTSLTWENAEIFMCADASFANVDSEYGAKTKSQAGYVVGLASPEVPDQNENRSVHILEWFSGTIRRVCRSTLSAECYAVVEGAEAADWIRTVLRELDDPGGRVDAIKAMRPEESPKMRASTWYSDAKSLVDLVLRDAGRPADKKLRIAAAQLRQMVDEDGHLLRWVDTSKQLADPLTKIGDVWHQILRVLATGEWSPAVDEAARQSKERIRAGRQARKQRKKDCESEAVFATGEESESFSDNEALVKAAIKAFPSTAREFNEARRPSAVASQCSHVGCYEILFRADVATPEVGQGVEREVTIHPYQGFFVSASHCQYEKSALYSV